MKKNSVAEIRVKLESEQRLRAAIEKHRSQKADDRCWQDDLELYAALGDGKPADNRVGDKLAMLRNCERFLEARCAGGQWKSYADLEASLANCLWTLKLVKDWCELNSRTGSVVYTQVCRALEKELP